jgi:hypothetical protein
MQMIRNIKALGLALAATLAIGAVAAQAASAQFHSNSPNEETWLTGTTTEGEAGVSEFSAQEQTIKCSQAHFVGRQDGNTTDSVVAVPEYTGCVVETIFGNVNATVEMGGCAYTFNSNGHVAVVDNPHLENTPCDENSPITYRVSIIFLGECHVKIWTTGNETLDGVTYHGTTEEEGKVEVTPEVSGIHGVSSGSLCASGTFEDGTYNNGDTTVEGFEDIGGDTSEPEEGDPVDLWVTHSET